MVIGVNGVIGVIGDNGVIEVNRVIGVNGVIEVNGVIGVIRVNGVIGVQIYISKSGVHIPPSVTSHQVFIGYWLEGWRQSLGLRASMNTNCCSRQIKVSDSHASSNVFSSFYLENSTFQVDC